MPRLILIIKSLEDYRVANAYDELIKVEEISTAFVSPRRFGFEPGTTIFSHYLFVKRIESHWAQEILNSYNGIILGQYAECDEGGMQGYNLVRFSKL